VAAFSGSGVAALGLHSVAVRPAFTTQPIAAAATAATAFALFTLGAVGAFRRFCTFCSVAGSRRPL
jgi:hypothetical protein